MRIFIGIDPRQPIAYNVAHNSIIRRISVPVSITPILLRTLPISRIGLTEFTYSRYMIPWMCGYQGHAVFMDADMMVRADVAELKQFYSDHPVSVVKNDLRYEWPSLMIFNNEKCKALTPEYVQTHPAPQAFGWAETIGELPKDWNHLVNYDPPNPNAKLVHFTQGIPCFEETKDHEYADEWHEELGILNSTVSWREIMGKSRHAEVLKG